MRVAFDLTSETGEPGGIATYWNALIDRLALRFPDDEWTLIGARDLCVSDALARHANVAYRLLGDSCGGSVRRRWRQQMRLPELLDSGGFDLVHSVNNVAPFRTRLPRVVTIHDWAARRAPARFGAAKKWFLNALIPHSAVIAERVITGSESARCDLEEGVRGLARERVVVIPHGVEPRFNDRPNAGEAERLRRRYGLPARFALFVGALEPGKNVGAMLAAQRQIAAETAAPPLVLAGGKGWGGELARARAAATSQPVQILGPVPDDDLPALYRAARLFLFPSMWEGFGLPVLEAFACGTPVVTSNTSSLPEVAGDAALLVDPADVAALARAWRLLWRDDEECRHLRARGIERAKSFTWERTAERTHEVYESVLAPADAAVPSFSERTHA